MSNTAALIALGLIAGAMVLVASSTPDEAAFRRMSARFAPVEIAADINSLPAGEKRALAKLVEASRLMDALFLRQVWAGNESLFMELAAAASSGDAAARARLDYFLLNKGPWSRLDHNQGFVAGVPEKPEAANFYPAGATKAEIEQWVATLPAAEKERAIGFFTTIRRTPPGSAEPFAIVPYSLEYQGELARAASLVRDAAAATADASLKRFLESRAQAFLSNDYYESDLAWMELDSTIEPTIGPYEVYEDEWFNQKAAFEAFITVRDQAESEKLAKFSSALQDIENHLPIDPSLRNPTLGALAPIRVVNVVLTAGDGNRGVQTAAYNLPNDERIIRAKGSKRVMLKNMQEAKFRLVLAPIAKVALRPADQAQLSFDAFFTHILMHELMHGLGPHNIQVAGHATTVRQELKQTYSTIEEAKADISGLWALQYLIDKGALPAEMQQTMYSTFLASAFRSIRFGLNEAHGRGIAIQLNTLLDTGAFVVAPDGTFFVDASKIRGAVANLTRDIMTLQAEGSLQKAQSLIDRFGVVRPEVQKVLDRLTDVPVDIAPRFVTADALERDDVGIH